MTGKPRASAGSLVLTIRALWKTLVISAPSFLESFTVGLEPAKVDARLRWWAKQLVDLAEIELTIEGQERVARDQASVVMSNHQSQFDIPIIFHTWPGASLRMVAKAELFRVPIWGQAMRAAGFIPVDRSGDRARAEAAMHAGAEAMRRGVSIWIAPEGTRSLDGRLGRFKKGGFLLAREARAPIVPVAIDGSRHILPKKTKRVRPGARVRVVFGEPIVVGDGDVAGAMARVRDFMAAHLSEESG